MTTTCNHLHRQLSTWKAIARYRIVSYRKGAGLR